VSVTIYFEGGGAKESTQSKMRQGLSEYCKKVSPNLNRLRIFASGGREQAFDDFKRALVNSREEEIVALLVDAETAVTTPTCTGHLQANDRWTFPELGKNRVFLMVQCMESWFLADRNALEMFYDGGFLAKSLPGSSTNIEIIRKPDVASGIKKATANTRTKGAYEKIGHGAVLLGLIDSLLVERASPHAKEFHDFLRAL
jgi:hypothetical protein